MSDTAQPMPEPTDHKRMRGMLLLALNSALDELTALEASVLGAVLEATNLSQPEGAPAGPLTFMEVVAELVHHRSDLAIAEGRERIAVDQAFLDVLRASYPDGPPTDEQTAPEDGPG